MIKDYNKRLVKLSAKLTDVHQRLNETDPSDPVLVNHFLEFQQTLQEVLNLQNETMTGMERAICDLIGLLEDIEECHDVKNIHHKIRMAKERNPIFW